MPVAARDLGATRAKEGVTLHAHGRPELEQDVRAPFAPEKSIARAMCCH